MSTDGPSLLSHCPVPSRTWRQTTHRGCILSVDATQQESKTGEKKFCAPKFLFVRFELCNLWNTIEIVTRSERSGFIFILQLNLNSLSVGENNWGNLGEIIGLAGNDKTHFSAVLVIAVTTDIPSNMPSSICEVFGKTDPSLSSKDQALFRMVTNYLCPGMMNVPVLVAFDFPRTVPYLKIRDL
ncbi:hypothetical protein DFH06DRAFT_1138025 [Mycena polygramma]|nr:hypothetical protein DFH06DRAFT_1138025 [Mycena polygramma]